MSIQPTGSFSTAAPYVPVVLPPQPTKNTPNALPPLDRTVVWDVPFDRVTLKQSVQRIEELVRRGEPSYVITANLNYVMLHEQESDLQAITGDADLILADGQPIVWRSKLGPNPLPERVAGSELIFKLAQAASQNRWGIYFLGGAEGVAETCAKRLARDYPGMRIAGIESPPFRELSQAEQEAQENRIRDSKAEILLVAFGQPKGERWIHEHYRRLGVPVSIQLGASFDFIAGTAKRAPKAWQKIGAEWAYRMLSDPKRLVPRYASNAMFLAGSLVKDWKHKVESWGMSVDDQPQAARSSGHARRQGD
ncbi:WecB/TagA/CpsF family glycosyltransferase [Rhodopirellula sp. MGV]|uniref:WecB/TagA/CpsF family glycosyltransferase n=1 Tax=Rhodopirellula sp. MGV TaxID=2023130 RepID=UPI000B9686DB|nr:WecB/TagA/CpsF family glycosyltransferase [Rhodopirellula sp. MGV]OYP28381.1 glycosyltransferase [Rhodopirellula sp. MGV]PNY38743.1 glycosyltransferase [Rhodopirellula baltica]